MPVWKFEELVVQASGWKIPREDKDHPVTVTLRVPRCLQDVPLSGSQTENGEGSWMFPGENGWACSEFVGSRASRLLSTPDLLRGAERGESFTWTCSIGVTA